MKDQNKIIERSVEQLLKSYEDTPELTNLQDFPLPTRECVTEITHNLESILFPGLVDCVEYQPGLQYILANKLVETYTSLRFLIIKCLQYAKHCGTSRISLEISGKSSETQAEEIIEHFLGKLPYIREMLKDDVLAAYKGDPAAKSYGEIILSYPGVRALAIHRLAHELLLLGVPILPRMMSEYVHNRTGIDIHPGAKIGRSLFIDHGTGVVIGETTVIGNHVKIYQGVTLGALSIPDPEKESISAKRHPTIEDNVTIYAGASILGGNTIVGAGSIIGSNVWLTHSVAPDTKVLYKQSDQNVRFLDNSKKIQTQPLSIEFYI